MTTDELRAALVALPCPHCTINDIDASHSDVRQEAAEYRELTGHWGSCLLRSERKREAAAVEAMLETLSWTIAAEDADNARAVYLAARRGE